MSLWPQDSVVAVDDFFRKLQPLGFEIDTAAVVMEKNIGNIPVPAFMKNIAAGKMIELHVRTIIKTGKNPLDIIVKKVKILETGAVLKIINGFEPTPINGLAENKGTGYSKGWDEISNRFKNKLKTIDIRALEMPLPQRTILEALETSRRTKPCCGERKFEITLP